MAIVTTTNLTSIDQLLATPNVSDEEKILFWMLEAKKTKALLASLTYKAQEVVDAYEDRFESIHGTYLGPIDEEVKELAKELSYVSKTQEEHLR